MSRLLAASPSAPLLGIAVVALVWMGADEGGFHGTTFMPVALALLALLAVGLLALPVPRPSRAQWGAIGLLASYAAWTYLSIIWADQQGLALDSANRTMLYAIVLALFALWPVEGRVAAGLAAAFALGVAGLGLVELVRAAATDIPTAFLDEGRFSEPTGYANANVALWTTALWPALILAGRQQLPPILRGALLASAGVLVAMAILGQSRGWAVVMPLMIVLAVAVVPGRGRTVGALALVGAASAAAAPSLLRVYERFDATASSSPDLSAALTAVLIAGGALFLAGVAWGALERTQACGEGRRLGTALVIGFVVCCIGALGAFTAVRGSPASEARNAWSEFTRGGKEPSFSGARLGSLGDTWRYDYWKVAWGEFTENPLIGVGGDNFGRDYLVEGESQQTPAYPHSVAIRTLSQTGLIGALFLGGAGGGAPPTALRRRGGIAAVSAGTGVIVFAYFMVHGLLDWFWEFPALGASAFALLGLATAVGPSGASAHRAGKPNALAIGVGGVATLAVALALTFPWLAERELREARAIASSDPGNALAKLDRAADLNPLSPLADKTAAVILRQQGHTRAAEQRFRATLADDPGDPFVYLQLATLASAAGREVEARHLIRRAATLNPRDAVTTTVRRRLETGQQVSPDEVDRMILRDVSNRIGRD